MPWWAEEILAAIELMEAGENSAALMLLKDMVPQDEDWDND